MNKLWILLPLALVGCAQDECEAALSTIEDKARECNLVNAEFFDTPTDEHDRKCEDADARMLSQQAKCTRQATCGALDGSDPTANRAYADCLNVP